MGGNRRGEIGGGWEQSGIRAGSSWWSYWFHPVRRERAGWSAQSRAFIKTDRKNLCKEICSANLGVIQNNDPRQFQVRGGGVIKKYFEWPKKIQRALKVQFFDTYFSYHCIMHLQMWWIQSRNKDCKGQAWNKHSLLRISNQRAWQGCIRAIW